MIDIGNISVSYRENTVLKDFSAKFEMGRLTSILGRNGSGKSTLLKNILSLVPLKAGTITIDGQDICSMKQNDIAKRVAYLPQGRAIPNMTVSQLVLHGRFPHISYPKRYSETDRNIALASIEQMSLKEHAYDLICTLSGGMRQRAYIAMALAQRTEHILLDEPTAYLDVSYQLETMRILQELANSGKSIICVTHDIPLALSFSDTVLVIDNGSAVFCGPPEEALDKGIIDSVFGVSVIKNTNSFSIELN